MHTDFIAKSEVLVDAPRETVWHALTDPETIRLYMFGATVETDWSVGGPISWKGEWDGQAYEDRGTVLRVEENDTLQFTHAGGLALDRQHTVTIGLGEEDGRTRITLVQDGNEDADEMENSRQSWQGMLEGLKLVVEREGIRPALARAAAVP